MNSSSSTVTLKSGNLSFSLYHSASLPLAEWNFDAGIQPSIGSYTSSEGPLTTLTVSGFINNGRAFADGTSARTFYVHPHLDFAPQQGFTWMCFVRTNRNNPEPIVRRGNPFLAQGWSLYYYASAGNAYSYMSLTNVSASGAAPYAQTYAYGAPNFHTWIHFAATYNASFNTTHGAAAIYHDGVLKNTTYTLGTLSHASNTTQLRFGSGGVSSTNLGGHLDECAYWKDYAMPAGEIAAVFDDYQIGIRPGKFNSSQDEYVSSPIQLEQNISNFTAIYGYSANGGNFTLRITCNADDVSPQYVENVTNNVSIECPTVGDVLQFEIDIAGNSTHSPEVNYLLFDYSSIGDAVGRAIMDGFSSSTAGDNVTMHFDKQVYVRLSNGTQAAERFDYYVDADTIHYFFDYDAFDDIFPVFYNMSPSVFFWQGYNMSLDEISSEVSELVNETY